MKAAAIVEGGHRRAFGHDRDPPACPPGTSGPREVNVALHDLQVRGCPGRSANGRPTALLADVAGGGQQAIELTQLHRLDARGRRTHAGGPRTVEVPAGHDVFTERAPEQPPRAVGCTNAGRRRDLIQLSRDPIPQTVRTGRWNPEGLRQGLEIEAEEGVQVTARQPRVLARDGRRRLRVSAQLDTLRRRRDPDDGRALQSSQPIQLPNRTLRDWLVRRLRGAMDLGPVWSPSVRHPSPARARTQVSRGHVLALDDHAVGAGRHLERRVLLVNQLSARLGEQEATAIRWW